MNELEMCKAIAELEGVESLYPECNDSNGVYVGGDTGYYNPITDLALNCALRDKYEIDIVYSLNYMSAEHPKNNGFTEFDNKKDISRAVIECILKSKGLWK